MTRLELATVGVGPLCEPYRALDLMLFDVSGRDGGLLVARRAGVSELFNGLDRLPVFEDVNAFAVDEVGR